MPGAVRQGHRLGDHRREPGHALSGPGRRRDVSEQGCGIKWFIPTSVIQGNLLLIWGVSLWKDLFVVSQKWSFPTTLYPKKSGQRPERCKKRSEGHVSVC